LSTWVKAHGFVASKEFASAITTFRLLDDRPLLRDNPELVASLGEALFLNGDYGSAQTTLQRVGKKLDTVISLIHVLLFVSLQ
jgi:hypothetical protein